MSSCFCYFCLVAVGILSRIVKISVFALFISLSFVFVVDISVSVLFISLSFVVVVVASIFVLLNLHFRAVAVFPIHGFEICASCS